MQKVKDYLLGEELELYKAMLEVQPQSMFLMDRDKNLIGIFNATGENLAGFTEEDIVGNSVLKYANDPESPLFQACTMLNSTFDTVFRTGTPLKFQYMIQDTYQEATITKISGDRVLSQVRDITDIASKLKDIEYKKHLELSVALMAGGLISWSYNVKENVISSSHNNNVIYNDMSKEDLIALIIPDHRQEVIQMFDDIVSRKIDHGHITIMSKTVDGKLQWSDVHAVPHEYSESGRVIRIIGSQKDITQEHDHNTRLQQLVKQNALILNNTSSGFAYITSDMFVEWENVSTVFQNAEISGLFKGGEMLNVSSDNECENSCVNAVVQVLVTKKQLNSKIKLACGMVVELIAQPAFSEDQELEGIVVRINDITEQEQAVYELAKAKDKAEQSDKLKSAFLANMSHEIRTPLNSIVGFTQLLPEAETTEEQMSYIEIINSNTQLLLNLINDILDLSKIEAGYFTCNDTVFDLSKMFQDIGTTFEKGMRDGVKLICDVPQSSYMVKLDPTRVIQVVSNFVTNAIKFTHIGYIKIGFLPMQNYVKLYVEDTGCGMTAKHAERVFERFEKFDSFEQGTGLGASIAKAIVDAYDGQIGVDTQVGEGSTFWAILPINMEKVVTPPQVTSEKELEIDLAEVEQTQAEEISEFLILVAEDNDSNYKLIEILLKGYYLYRAVNGIEALEMARRRQFSAILMDIRMPLMDGVEAIRMIREFDTSTPIVALTANAFDDDMRRAYEVGANDFLTKPINRKKFIVVQ